jgi:hypothetical protein
LKIVFYDNQEVEHNDSGVLDIDRVYCLDFNNFTKDDWSVLGGIYSKLPNQIIENNIGQQMWFGIEDSSEFYLWASAEPSGLQVVGDLREHDWKQWEKLFHDRIEHFPFFEV